MTAEDYRLLPESVTPTQLIKGELIMSPSPNRYHHEICRNLGFLLLKFLEQNTIGELFFSPFDVYLTPSDVFQPDLVYIAEDRVSIISLAGAEGAPTLVVEVLSTGTAGKDQTDKKEVYARAGVEEMWIIDPASRNIAVYRLQEAPNQPKAVIDANGRFESRCSQAARFTPPPSSKAGFKHNHTQIARRC